jgi:hypothetical protein
MFCSGVVLVSVLLVLAVAGRSGGWHEYNVLGSETGRFVTVSNSSCISNIVEAYTYAAPPVRTQTSSDLVNVWY